jgi:membrane protein
VIGRLRRSLVGRVVEAYANEGMPNYAAGLAFNAFLTMFPIVLGLVALFGLFLRGSWFYNQMQYVLLNAFPIDAQNQIRATLEGAGNHAGELGLVSLLALLWSGTGLFGSLEFAMNRVYGFRGRNPFRMRLHGLRLIAAFVLAVVVMVVLNTAIAFLSVPFLNISTYLGAVAGWVVVAALLVAIYRLTPARALPLSDVLPGALLAGALVEVITLAFPLIAAATERYSTYARAFSFVFLLTTWLYLLSSLILFGALVNRLLAGGEVPESEHAPVGAVLQHGQRRRVQGEPDRELDQLLQEGGADRPQDVAVREG